MNKIKQCLIVVGNILDPTPMYESGYKFLYRCGMHFVSLGKVLYSIHCDNVFKKNPTHDEVAFLTQCNQSLVPDGEQKINNTNKAIIKYAINEGLKDIGFIANNSYNFQAENLTLDTIHPNYGREFCKVLPHDCNSIPVGDYINKTLSVLNGWNHSETKCSNSISVPLEADNVSYYLTAGAALVAGVCIGAYIGYRCAGYRWAHKSKQMGNTAPNLLKIDVGEAEISDKNLESDSTKYNSIHSYYEIGSVDSSVSDNDSNGQVHLPETLTICNSPNIIYMAAYDATTNHEENTYMLPVEKNGVYA